MSAAQYESAAKQLAQDWMARAERWEALARQLGDERDEAVKLLREVSSAEANYDPTLETDAYYRRRALAFQQARAFLAALSVYRDAIKEDE